MLLDPLHLKEEGPSRLFDHSVQKPTYLMVTAFIGAYEIGSLHICTSLSDETASLSLAMGQLVTKVYPSFRPTCAYFRKTMLNRILEEVKKVIY